MISTSSCFSRSSSGRTEGTFEDARSITLSGSKARMLLIIMHSSTTSSGEKPTISSRWSRSRRPSSHSSGQGTSGLSQSSPASMPSASTSTSGRSTAAAARRTTSWSQLMLSSDESPSSTARTRCRRDWCEMMCRTIFSRSGSPFWTARRATRGKTSASAMMAAHASSAARFIHSAAVSASTAGSLERATSCRAKLTIPACLLAIMVLTEPSIDK
mmetsp:Transcript_58271/g.127813  ORF Transcript_58271/g.127813 Transcript_58271/m.127813 type:complete len:215 (+) Transcript_58271:481-1125(+)